MPEAGPGSQPARPLTVARAAAWVAGALLALNAAAEPGCLRLDATLEQHLVAAADAAEAWLLRNQRTNGLFTYRYNPATAAGSQRNNALRQLMASRVLAGMAAEDAALLPVHRRNLAFVLTHWYRESKSGLGYIEYSSKSKLGANAMALRTLVASVDFDVHTAEARRLADGIVSLIEPDGRMRAWFIEPGYDYDEPYLLHFYSGEAILALLEYADRAGSARYATAAGRAQAYYRRLYVDRLDEHYYPAYVPWHTFTLERSFRQSRDPDAAAAIFRLNDKLLEILDRQIYRGRFYDPRFPALGSPHAASDGIYTESLAHAWAVAATVGDDVRRERYREALELALRHLVQLQYRAADVPEQADPDKVVGALRTDVRNPAIRLDNVQHAIDAFRATLALRCLPSTGDSSLD